MFLVRIWDSPTRIFHWALVLCVLGLVITGNVGGSAMAWHFRCGYGVFCLLLFRLVWGCVGGHWSAWWRLPLSPRSLLSYLRGQATPDMTVGHNPLGAWAILAMLGWLGLQVATGLVSDDEIANAGPLTRFVSGSWVSLATAWHKGLGKGLLIALVLVHVTAIAWYHFRKRQALVAAMVHGNKALPQPAVASKDTPSSWALALAVVLGCAWLVRWIVSQGSN